MFGHFLSKAAFIKYLANCQKEASALMVLLLLFIYLPANAQFPGKPADTTVMPALFRQLNQTQNDRLKLKLYLKIGYIYLLKPAEFDRDMKMGLRYADQALKLANRFFLATHRV